MGQRLEGWIPAPVLPELVRHAWSLLLNAIARLGAVCTSEGLDLQSSSPLVCWDFFSACLSFSLLHNVAFVPYRLHTCCSFFSLSQLLHVTSQTLAFLGISHFCNLLGGATCTVLFQYKCQQPTADLYLAAGNVPQIL